MMIEKVVAIAVSSLQISIIASFHQLTSDLETEIGRLVGKINSNYNRLVETQEAHDQRLHNIEVTQADLTGGIACACDVGYHGCNGKSACMSKRPLICLEALLHQCCNLLHVACDCSAAASMLAPYLLENLA